MRKIVTLAFLFGLGLGTAVAQPPPGDSPKDRGLTAPEAKAAAMNKGYSDVSELTQSSHGLWKGYAKKDGKTVGISVDQQGQVSAK